jgi:hypothetical protein
MKKVMVFVLAVLGSFAIQAKADVAVVNLIVTNGQAITYSEPINANGYLDKIEITQDAGAATTSTVTIATYSGTTAVETYATATSLTGNKVIRPRFALQTTAGAVVDSATNAVLEKALIGGNVKMAVTGTVNDGSNEVKAYIYYIPIK